MQKNFEVEKKDKYLYVTYCQIMNRDGMDEFLREVPGIARASGRSRILLDFTNTHLELELLDHYEGGDAFSRYFKGLELAIVFEKITDNDRFGETMAISRGGRLGIFTTFEEAFSWLGIVAED